MLEHLDETVGEEYTFWILESAIMSRYPHRILEEPDDNFGV